MNDKLKIELLQQVLQDLLDDEADDFDEVVEFGGYRFDNETREKIERAIEITDN